MAQSTAERQKRYRKKRAEANSGEGEKCLSTWLSTKAMLALKRLAAHEQTTQREILERLILTADDELLKSLHSNEENFEAYLARSLHRNDKK